MPLATKRSMSVREIPSREWPAFLNRLGREHRAWLAAAPGALDGLASAER
jgi:hypothetical protein